jgi:tryptophan synthase beta chain
MESAHAVAETIKRAQLLSTNKIIICNLSGRGDKDLFITAPKFDDKFLPFLHNYIHNYDS